MEISNDLLKQIRESNDLALKDVERHQLTFSRKRPSEHTFFMVHPTWAKLVALLEVEDQDPFIVKTDLIPSIQTTIKIKTFYAYITRDGVLGFWGTLRPDPDKRAHPAVTSGILAAQAAMKSWIRVLYNKKSSSYEIVQAKENLGDPKWPNKDFDELFAAAFQRNFIDSLDHPEIRKLEGHGL